MFQLVNRQDILLNNISKPKSVFVYISNLFYLYKKNPNKYSKSNIDQSRMSSDKYKWRWIATVIMNQSTDQCVTTGVYNNYSMI